MDSAGLKKKLRSIKKTECALRTSGQLKGGPDLVWDHFFDLSENGGQTGKKTRYDLNVLKAMTREQIMAVIDEYWAYVYGELFREALFIQERLFYDREALILLGLPFDADEALVKRRFRELAKKHHPDTGGDAKKFIELMTLYRKLILK